MSMTRLIHFLIAEEIVRFSIVLILYVVAVVFAYDWLVSMLSKPRVEKGTLHT
jgi:hypothetical protein